MYINLFSSIKSQEYIFIKKKIKIIEILLISNLIIFKYLNANKRISNIIYMIDNTTIFFSLNVFDIPISFNNMLLHMVSFIPSF